MTDLQTLFHAVNDLNADEIDQLQQYIEKRRTELRHPDEDIETRIAALHAALDEFRDGLTEQELQQLVEAMTVKYHFPMKDLAMYDWLDQIPEDER